MEKINIAELLKDCPKGMELDCYLFNGLEFDHIDTDNEIYSIVCRAKTLEGNYDVHTFTKYGWYNFTYDYSKCVIFPKGKTTWEGFQRPFKDGDVVRTTMDSIAILGNRIGEHSVGFRSYCGLFNYEFDTDVVVSPERFATEEEKAKLFNAIKANGYKWNAENKTLEKLVEQKFKVGDKIRHKTHIRQGNVVTEIKDTHYILDDELALPFISQDEYELVPNKFDINTLKPFDKVLVRNHEKNEWQPNFFNKYCKEINSFKLIGVCTPSYVTHEHFVNYCIPYEGNKHLCGKTDDCDEYFKTWE